MATTHDMRYEQQDTKRSLWSWLVPLALLALAAIALSSYLANDNRDTLNSGSVNNTLNTPTSEYVAE